MMNMEGTKVVLGQYKGLEVVKPFFEVTEEEIQVEFQKACALVAKNEEKTDEPAEAGDLLTIDFVGYLDGKPFPGGEGTNFPLTLGSNTFIPGFEEQMIGSRAGDIVDVDLAFPENYHEKNLAGKPVVFKVRVNSIRTNTAPEMSDEVVQRVSQCKTVEEFHEYVHGEIYNSKKMEAARHLEDSLMEKVMEGATVSVTDEAIQERKQGLINSLTAQLQQSQMSLNEYMKYHGITQQEFDSYMERDAKIMLEGQAVLGAIAEKEGLVCDDEELNREMAEMALSYHMDFDQIGEALGQDGRELIRQDVLTRKALDLIVEHAIVTD